MQKLIFIVVLFLLITTGKAAAQTYSGHVADKSDGQPLSGVIVTALDGRGKIIKYTTTNKAGDFAMSIQNPVKLEFSMMSYKKVSVKASAGKLIILMSMESTNLKEVYVKAPKLTLRGDTLAYNVASYAEAQDKNIGDVIKKMPGIEIKKDGEIYYNGEPINKFYIDGNDMVSDRYGLATNNIKPEDVQKVEVLEHHQPIKSLKNKVFSDKAAINLKLKESAKARWAGNQSGAGGYANSSYTEASKADKVDNRSILYNGNAFLMRMGEKNQTMISAKTDNTGKDFSSDLESFTIEDYEAADSKDYKAETWFSAGTTAAPLDSRRTRFNRSALMSFDNSKKLSDDYTFNVHLDYYYDRLTSLYTGNTKYYLKDSSINDNTFETAKAYTHKEDIKMHLKANTDKFYMYEGLKAGLAWQDAKTYTAGTYPNRQNAWTPLNSFQNNLKYIKNADNSKTFTIASVIKYITQNQNLQVNRDISAIASATALSAAISTTTSTSSSSSSAAAADSLLQHQTINTKALYTNNNIAFSGNVGAFVYDFSCGAEALWKSLKTNLSGVKNTSLIMVNNLTTGYLGCYVKPSLTYKTSSIRIEFQVPTGYYYSFIRQADKKLERENAKWRNLENKNSGMITYKPEIYFTWYLTGKFMLSASASIGKDAADVDNIYVGGIMSGYRNISCGINDFAQSKSESISVSINYKDPLNGLFFNAGAARTWNKNPYLSSQQFDNEYIISSYYKESHNTTADFLYGGITKNIDALGGPIKLDASYTRFNYNLMQSIAASSSGVQGISTAANKIKYISSTLSISPHLTFHFSSWLNTEYTLNYQHSTLKFADRKATSHNSYSQKLDLNFVVGKHVTFQLVTEHYHTELGGANSTINSSEKGKRTKDMLLQDFMLQWKVNKSLSINLYAYNLFNKKEYAYTVFSGSTSISSSYRIRPRNVMAGFLWSF
jgi:hypothetical protein